VVGIDVGPRDTYATSMRQIFPALGHPPSQDLSTAYRTFPREKAMFAFAFSL